MEPDLLPDEAIVDSWLANQVRRGIPVGGRLWLTDRRVVFVPNQIERMLGRRNWSSDLSNGIEVHVVPRGIRPFPGALRQRLIVRRDDDAASFFVRPVDAAASSIRAVIPNA